LTTFTLSLRNSSKYPASTVQLLASEDKAYFLTISQRRGQKPVPFIPILDSGSRRYRILLYSPISVLTHLLLRILWQAEDIEAVFDQDPERGVCILQGPVAAKHSKIKDEPIKDLLGNINSSLVDKLVERIYGGDTSKIPTIELLGSETQNATQAGRH
jgi:fatty acid synthase subunit alpha